MKKTNSLDKPLLKLIDFNKSNQNSENAELKKKETQQMIKSTFINSKENITKLEHFSPYNSNYKM